MTPQSYPSLRELLKRSAGTPNPQRAADELLRRLEEHHPDFTGVGVFKSGPYAPALILPVGPSCPLKNLEEALTATVQKDRTLYAYWRKP